MLAQHANLGAQTILRDVMVFLAPLVPFLPLVAAHPTEHQRDSLLVGKFNNMFARDFRFPAKNVHAEVLHVTKNVRFASFVVLVQKVWGVHAAARQKVSAIYLEIEIAALSNASDLPIPATKLQDLADSQTAMANVRDFSASCELQMEVV